MDNRPPLNKQISIKDFTSFYWLKEELLEFCKKEGLSRQGGKIQIAHRIETYLTTGEKKAPPTKKKATSKFDWNKKPLTLETVITDNYKNSENVRAFFQEHIETKFKFNTKFMTWMKQNVGQTLEEAIKAWHSIELEQKGNKKKKEIAPQFEYNRYIRDFLADNPEAAKATAIKYWTIKRSRRGDNRYSKLDIDSMQEENEA